jgi:hypothetical protein
METTIPDWRGKDLKKGTLRSIIIGDFIRASGGHSPENFHLMISGKLMEFHTFA